MRKERGGGGCTFAVPLLMVVFLVYGSLEFIDESVNGKIATIKGWRGGGCGFRGGGGRKRACETCRRMWKRMTGTDWAGGGLLG